MKSNIDMLDERLYAQAETIDWKEYEKIGKSKSYIWKKDWTRADIDAEIDKVFGKYAPQAHRIAFCESGKRQYAVGDTWSVRKSYGIFQIRTFSSRPAPSELFNPKVNIAFAFKLFKASGYRFSKHWVNCSIKTGVK